MCGIVGYTGKQQAVPILLEGLSKLEYRGYDSAGICVQTAGGPEVVKTKGRLQALEEKLREHPPLTGSTGIGHTRWATHGVPSDANSHPHVSHSGKIALVHNGIIENEAPLRKRLQSKGICFHSQTDTEVVANLVGYYYDRDRELLTAVRHAMTQLEGSFALGILCADLPDTLVAVKKDSPLIVGLGQEESFIASDVPAILKRTRIVVYMEDGELAVLNGPKVCFFNSAGEEIDKQPEQITWEVSGAEKGGYAHFMLKEIMEQPKALRDTIYPRIRDGQVELGEVQLPREYLMGLKKIYLVACGSAYYVSVLAKYTIERACRIPTEAIMASEFRYSHPVIGERDLVIIISQSGETADTLAALREAKRLGSKTLAIVNVVGSAIAKQADQVLYTWAGPEIAVATTKAFSTQLAAVYLLALHMARQLNTLSDEEYEAIVTALKRLPEDVEQALREENLEKCQYLANRYCGRHDAFYIGRNLDSALCLEGSLKLKEVAYLHSEAYPAGELKHGPISMIQEGTLVVALNTVDGLFDKTMANIREVKARGADVLCIIPEGKQADASAAADSLIAVPRAHPMLQPSLGLIPLQLFSYYVAVNRGCDVDKPRNLAKSVTVE